VIGKTQKLHFVGICGTAMGSVAAALRDRDFVITGSDESVYPPMSTFLESKGIALRSGFRPENIPDDADVIVIGNAMKRGNPEVEAILNRKLCYVSLPELLKELFLRDRHNLVVSGTHGKTTTTSLLAWILTVAELDPTYVIGGLPANLEQGARFTDSKYVVIEGDEYDSAFFDKRSKFFHYLPELLIVNNIEFDHADIFNNLDEIKLSFRRLFNIVPQNGMILLNGDDANCVDVARQLQPLMAQIEEVGFSPNCARKISDVTYTTNGSYFVLGNDKFEIPMVGEFNVRNAAMAISAARFYGISLEHIRKALQSFKGIARRQEVRGEVRGITVIDDFAHHPTALRETLRGLQHRFPGSRIWAVFEPRSNTTRRAVFQHELPEALKLADGVFISQIARLEQIPEKERLDPQAVMKAIAAAGRPAFYEPDAAHIIEKLVPLLKQKDVVAIFSNGGFDGIHEKLLAAIRAAPL
jgi:UDP-N-acetylmuramate: L-alanyl-gamma-D-glutamyl-meso-diaminopimelate ligase